MQNELSATVVYRYGIVQLSPRRWAVMRTATSEPTFNDHWEVEIVLKRFQLAYQYVIARRNGTELPVEKK